MKVVKTVVFGVVGVCVVAAAAIIATVKYLQSKENSGEETEKIFVDELTVGEVKQWFEGKLLTDDQKGVLFYPTEENIQKWNIEISASRNSLIQIVYDTAQDTVMSYREIIFSELSENLSQLLEENGGTLVIER